MRIGLFFVLLACTSLAVGLLGLFEGTWIPLAISLWPTIGFVLVSLAYVTDSPRMFGKRQDGTLPAWSMILLFPFFALTWAIWQILRHSGERCWDQVAPGLYLGRRPYPAELPHDASLIVDLTAEFPRPPGLGSRGYLCLPTLDGATPREDACKALVEDLAEHQEPLYIHCAQGHGRSALVVGLLLVRRQVVSSAREAEHLMKAIRPGVSLSVPQRRMMAKLSNGASLPQNGSDPHGTCASQ